MNARSNLAVVRNPVLQLPAAQQIKNLPPVARAAFSALMRDISADARVRAETCWRKHKAPMAAYWKAVAVYAGHAARAARPAGDIAEEARCKA